MTKQEKEILKKYHHDRAVRAWHTRKRNRTPEELKEYFSKLGKSGAKKRWKKILTDKTSKA